MLRVHTERVLTFEGNPPFSGQEMKNVKEYLDVDIIIEDGKIVDIRKHQKADLKGKLALAGFSDAHTHIPFYGSRSNEFYLRAKGAKYIDILNAGGGIYKTAKKIDVTDKEEIIRFNEKLLSKMLSLGVTTVECKTGYGLNLENEIKQLEILKELEKRVSQTIVKTFLPFHARVDKENYFEEVKNSLKVIKERYNVKFLDAFLDKGVFLPEEIREIALYAKNLGYDLRFHSDEIENVGATVFGVEVGARSVDHVLKITDEDIEKLKNSDTMVVLMPSTSFYLGEQFAQARKIISAGIPVALGSDFNPGSSPLYSPSFVLHLTIRFLHMDWEEALCAYTANSSYLLGVNSGLIQPGYNADIVLYSTYEFLDIPYMFQDNFIEHIIKNGKIVF